MTYIAAQSAIVKIDKANARPWSEHRDLINGAWAKGAASYIEAAKHLVDAKAELSRDEFKSLITLHELNFDPSVSRKLLCIGENRLLCCAPGHKLPPGWTIAYELSKVKDDVLKAALADGRVHPRMKRKDAVELHTPTRPKKPAAPAVEPETLSEHWRRVPAELTTLLNDVGFTGVREAMSEEFAADMCKAQPTRAFAQYDTDTIVDQITGTCAISKVEAIAKTLLKFVADKRKGNKTKDQTNSRARGIAAGVSGQSSKRSKDHKE